MSTSEDGMATQWEYVARMMSNALLRVRPLGGSEMFKRHHIGGQEYYFADPDFCGRAIDELRERALKSRASQSEDRNA